MTVELTYPAENITFFIKFKKNGLSRDLDEHFCYGHHNLGAIKSTKL